VSATAPIHATAVACRVGGHWRAVLLTGPSGAGKSDLALRLIDRGWRLVADDYAEVWASGEAVFATAPGRIVGRIEARGVGVVDSAPRWIARIALVVACGQTPPERMPEPATTRIAGLELPLLALDIRPASAVQILTLALGSALRQF
jgi:serine kinase of HPr protein (carbohydrate metabolism regulator)